MSPAFAFAAGFAIGGLAMSLIMLAVRRGHPRGRRRDDSP